MQIYFENTGGQLKEISVDKLRNLVIDRGHLLQLWYVDDKGSLYFRECGEYA